MHYFNEAAGEFRNIAMVGQMYEALRATRGWVKDCEATGEVLDADESSISCETEEGKA